jgi:hypothetical protein
MPQRNWLIGGVSSGFGRIMTEQLLVRGDRIAGTVRDLSVMNDLKSEYGDRVWLAELALLALHPIIALTIGAAWALKAPLRWLAEGLFVGEGVRMSGVVSRLSSRPTRSRGWRGSSGVGTHTGGDAFAGMGDGATRSRTAPRGRGRRPQEYFPFDDGIDHLGD